MPETRWSEEGARLMAEGRAWWFIHNRNIMGVAGPDGLSASAEVERLDPWLADAGIVEMPVGWREVAKNCVATHRPDLLKDFMDHLDRLDGREKEVQMNYQRKSIHA